MSKQSRFSNQAAQDLIVSLMQHTLLNGKSNHSDTYSHSTSGELKYAVIPQCFDKLDYGDIDFVVSKKYHQEFMSALVFDETVNKNTKIVFNNTHIIYHMYNLIHQIEYTIDEVHSDNVDFALYYHGFGGLGSILGVMLKPYRSVINGYVVKLKLRDDGLYACYEDQNILITSNFIVVCMLLDIKLFGNNLKTPACTKHNRYTSELVVSQITSSRFFNHELFNPELKVNKDMKNRPLFQKISNEYYYDTVDCEFDDVCLSALDLNLDYINSHIEHHKTKNALSASRSSAYNGGDVLRVLDETGLSTSQKENGDLIKKLKRSLSQDELVMLPKYIADDVVCTAIHEIAISEGKSL